MASTTTSTTTIDIPSSDLLHLIQSHLTECGLHATSSTLRLESGGVIGMPGLFPSTKGTLVHNAQEGRWGEVLQLLESLDLDRVRKSYLEDYNRSIVSNYYNDGGDGGDGEQHDGGSGGAPAAENNNNSSSLLIITPLEKTVAMAHEMTILELAEQNEVELAYATLRMCSELLDRSLIVNSDEIDNEMNENNGDQEQQEQNAANNNTIGMMSSRSGDVERRITALSSMRRTTSSSSSDRAIADHNLLPANYYGPSNPSKQKRRDQIAKLLKRHVPEVPLKRLSSLLQQSIKWQCHTGMFPTVQRLFQQINNDDDDNIEDDNDGNEGGEDNEGKKKKKKRSKKKNVEQKFDLVLGNVDMTMSSGDGKKKRRKDGGIGSASGIGERIPARPHQTIRLGKKSYIESACFLPDGKGLVTGSSDGFIEVWGEPIMPSSSSSSSSNKDGKATNDINPTHKPNDLDSLLSNNTIDYEKLRTSDLPYQRNDDLMMHDSSVLAMTVSHDGALLGTTSSDGTVCVWKIADGKLLRRMERAHGGVGGSFFGYKMQFYYSCDLTMHDISAYIISLQSKTGAAVTCIQFSPDGSKILTGGHDSTCREFGLMASRMLKEFRGHKSYVNCCGYVVLPHSAVAGASGGDVGGGGNNTITPSHHHGGNTFLSVVTASADGSVRVWDGRTAEPVREITPPIPTSANAVIDDKDSIVGSKSIHTVVHLHSPSNTMIVIPRADRAYLMSYSGAVLRVFTRDDVQGTEFLAAAVSTSNQWLFVAADDGKCVVFDVNTGKVEKIIRSFAEECSSGRGEKVCEMSGLVCHPSRGFVGGYSNDKGQKRGILTLWK
ncbi:hypothetical protein ACHAXR_012597 [Thalassiosira sp. AJA248-18]